MILGRITGKTTTKEFKFLVEHDTKKFQYIQLMHNNQYILAQVLEIEKDSQQTIAFCDIIGYRDEEGILKPLHTPPEPGNEILKAEDDFVKEILGLEINKNGAYIGKLDGRDNLKVYLDLNKLLTKHVAVLAKSGSGKSYSVAVLIEELIEKKVPVIIIDPHGEYSTLSYQNLDDKEKMLRFGIEAKGYAEQVQEFSPDVQLNPQARPLKLNKQGLSSSELINILPAKLSNAQLGTLYSALKNLGGKADFDELIIELEAEESSVKWSLINILEYIKKLNLFSDDPTSLNELIQPNKASIINLKGINPDVQEIIVYKLINDLFQARKKNNLPPFFLVLEEAHNYCPERSFGEAKSSSIVRQIAAEGRKFGLGLCIVSQRPARVDKSVLSQLSTQIILKVTNPNDLKAISSSVEGITYNTEKDIKNIPIGTAMVVGVVDLPLLVNIRPRKSKHGGEAVKIFEETEEKDVVEELNDFEEEGEILPLIKQKISAKDLQIMSEKQVRVSTNLIPCLFLSCQQDNDEFSLVINLNNGHIVQNIETGEGTLIQTFGIESLSQQQQKVLNLAIKLKEFKASQLFSESDMQFSEINDLVNILKDKGFLVKENDNFKISDKINFFINLKDYSVFERIDFSRIDYKNKLEKKCDIDKLKSFLAQFINIKEGKECWLINYSLEETQQL